MKTLKKIWLLASIVVGIISCKDKNIAKSESTIINVNEPPINIILIMSDDQGYGDIALHGNKHIKTPNIDQLGRESVRFDNFHVGTTCTPTRAGLMSGMNCNRVGAWHTVNGRSLLSPRFETVATKLKRKGYETGIFGKWHLGDNYPYRPQDRGFTESLVHGGGGVGQTPDYWNNDYFDDTYFRNGVPEKKLGYCTDIWFNESIKFIEKSSKENKPFFCYLSTNAPHGPYHVPQKYIDMYKGNPEIPNPNFYGMITNFDENLGKLRGYLKANDLEKNTIIIFLTDNGTSAGAYLDKDGYVKKGFNAQMRGTKVWHYEGGHRVPLYVKFPNSKNIRPNVQTALTTYTDLVPTMLDMVGIKDNTKYDGVSLLPILTKENQPKLKDRIVVVDTQRGENLVKWKKSCVMKGSWRLIDNKELYDLSKDVSQKENIINKHPEKAKELAKAYEIWWDDIIEDAKIDNLISVGHPKDSPTLITAHDWHADKDSPWNQKIVRNLQVSNGYWLLNVEQEGDYKIKLYRYPPNTNYKFNEEIPKGDEVEGGEPYPIGKGVNYKYAKIAFDNFELKTDKPVNNTYFEFKTKLKKGRTRFKTWLMDGKEIVMGAYYIVFEKV